jgi:hypothetical protein
MRILVVYWWPPGPAMRLAVERHLHALDGGPAEIVYANAADPSARDVRHGRYDGIVLHTTFLCLRWSVDFARVRREWRWLGNRHCPIVALPQDEFRYSAVLDEWLDELEVEVVFSCFDGPTRAPIYGRAQASFRPGLTGYLDRKTADYFAEHALPAAQRPYDIVYRASQLPFRFGRHAQLKHAIGLATAERAERHGLRVDISTRLEDTIVGVRWLDFVMSGRAIVGAESGSSVLDRRGEVERRARELLALEPELSFDEFDRRMPAGWDSWAFFAISPRHLEAVLARTCQVLVEGSYSGVLEPHRHYLPVRRDFSDLDDVLEHLLDPVLVQEITERAYEEVYLAGAWKAESFAAELLGAMAEERTPRTRRPALRSPIVPALIPTSATRTRLRHATVAAQALAARPRLALPIVRDWLGNPRDADAVRAVARDLLRLGALDRFEEYQRERGGRWCVRATTREGQFVLESAARPPAGSAGGGTGVREIVWDHSRYGRAVSVAPGSRTPSDITIGSDGRWRFRGLSRLAERRPELDWEHLILGRRGRSAHC